MKNSKSQKYIKLDKKSERKVYIIAFLISFLFGFTVSYITGYVNHIDIENQCLIKGEC